MPLHVQVGYMPEQQHPGCPFRCCPCAAPNCSPTQGRLAVVHDFCQRSAASTLCCALSHLQALRLTQLHFEVSVLHILLPAGESGNSQLLLPLCLGARQHHPLPLLLASIPQPELECPCLRYDSKQEQRMPHTYTARRSHPYKPQQVRQPWTLCKCQSSTPARSEGTQCLQRCHGPRVLQLSSNQLQSCKR